MCVLLTTSFDDMIEKKLYQRNAKCVIGSFIPCIIVCAVMLRFCRVQKSSLSVVQLNNLDINGHDFLHKAHVQVNW